MIISRTPVRISLFGGGTDYPDYYKENGGIVIGTTIDKYVYVSINQLSDFFEYKIRVGYSKSELANNVDDIVHPSVRECLKYKDISGNLDVHIFADLPAKTGLGSSSSFTVGFLNALHALEGKCLTRDTLASQAIHVEQKLIKENVGSQDQIHAAFGGLNIIEFGAETFKVRPLIISKPKKELLQESMMIFYTGQTRFASEILTEQVKRTKNNSNNTYLSEITEIAHKAINVFSDAPINNFTRSVGELLHESWSIKKSLSKSVTNDLIDDAYERAVIAGAYGGKISGAGGGGFLTLIVDIDKQNTVREALKNFLEVKFELEDTGSTIIYLN